MASHPTPKPDELAALELARGGSYADAAVASGLSLRTINRRMADADFRQRVRELRSSIVDQNAAKLSAGAAEAVETLTLLLHPPTPSTVRLGAARSIIELSVKLRESVELEARIAALEAGTRVP